MAFTRCLQGSKTKVRRMKRCYSLANDLNRLQGCVTWLALKAVLISRDALIQTQEFLLDPGWFDLDGGSSRQD